MKTKKFMDPRSHMNHKQKKYEENTAEQADYNI